MLIDCCLLAVISGQTIVKAPVNTAARVGSRVIFNYTAITGDDYVIWNYAPAGRTWSIRIYVSKKEKVDRNLQDKFDIERDDVNGVHNLVIKNVRIDLGVRYTYGFALEGSKGSVELVALRMLCSFTASFRWGPRELAP